MRPSFTSAVLLAALTVLSSDPLAAQAAPPAITRAGPVIESGGMSAQVPDATFRIPQNHVFRVVWEISAGSDTVQSPQLETIARFYNLHVRNGVAVERLKAAAVFHTTGWIALLSDSAHIARYGRPNPSKRLVEELLATGAQLVVCGQTAAFRGVRREELLPGVQLGISAMTALNIFWSQGYMLNPWR